MNKPYAFSSIYNDYTLGAILEYHKAFGKTDELTGSLQYKQDVHREHNLGEPVAKMSDITTTAALENQLHLTGQLLLRTGLSLNNRSSLTAQHYDSDQGLITAFPSNHNNAVNIQGGLQYRIAPNNQLSISIARKTRFATTKDRYSYSMGTALPNPGLKAESTLNYDLSYSGACLNNTLAINAAAFYSKISNTILSVSNVSYDSATGTALSQLQNVGSAEYTGIELGLNYQPLKTLKTCLNYTYIKRNNLSNPGIYFTDVPRGKLFGFIQYCVKSIVSLQVNGEYDAKRYSTSYGTTAAAFTLFNASARIHIWKYFSLEGGVQNLFDKNYAYTEGFPEPGRNYFVNIDYRF